MIVEGTGTGSKYFVALDFVPKAINFSIVLVAIAVVALVVVLLLVLRFCVVANTPPPPLTFPHQPQLDPVDLMLLRKRRLTPLPVLAGRVFFFLIPRE